MFSDGQIEPNLNEAIKEDCTTPESSGYGSTVLDKRRRKSNIAKAIIDKALPNREKKGYDFKCI